MIMKLTWPLMASLLIGGSLLQTSCGGEKKSGGAKMDHPVVTGVKVITIQPQAVPEYFEAVGTVKSINTSVVSSKVRQSFSSSGITGDDATNTIVLPLAFSVLYSLFNPRTRVTYSGARSIRLASK